MQVTETLTDGLKRGFTVVVPEPELAEKREKRLKELGRTLQLPGFRPGKVPMSMVRKRYGDAVAAEIVEGAVNDASDRLLSERGLRPAMQPKLEVTRPGHNSDLEFTIEMEVLPEISLPELTGISLTKLGAPVGEDAIEAALKTLAEQLRAYTPVETPRPAAAGEQLTVDFIGRVDGEAFAGGTAKDVNLIVAGPGFIPGFTEQVEGITPGETRTISVTFPADYHAKDLAGKAAEFEITAKALAVSEVPVIDDALAVSKGFESVADLREKISEQLGRDYEAMARQKLKRGLLDALSERAAFAAPESLVEAEFTEIWREVLREKAAGRTDPEDAAKDEETLKAEYRGIADRRVRLGLLVAEIGRVNGITVTDQDLQRAMINEVIRHGERGMEMIEFYKRNPGTMERFRGPVFEDKVVDYLLGQVTVEDKQVTAEELAAELDA